MSNDDDIGSVVMWAAFDKKDELLIWTVKESKRVVEEFVRDLDGVESLHRVKIKEVAVHWRKDRHSRSVKRVDDETGAMEKRIADLLARNEQLEQENEVLRSLVEGYQKRFGEAIGKEE